MLGIAALAIAGTIALASPALAATNTLAPALLTTTAGTVGSGQTVSNLAVQDQSGTTDTWTKYVEFGGAYVGYRTYTLPAAVAPSAVTAVQVSANYRGPATAQQSWTWSLYNWSTAAWTSVGTNSTAPSWGSWKLLSFASPSSPTAFVNAAGSIRVQLKANNASDAADIDFESVLVTSGTATADTTAPSTPTSLAVSATPTATSISLGWTASTDNVGVTGYEVFQNGGTAAVASVTGTSATISGLSASTGYTFTVKAKDAAGNRSAASTSVAATTAASGGTTSFTLPPAAGKFSYQLGGAYTPEVGAQVVSRDRLAASAGSGFYNVCYVNILQTQETETAWWRTNHNALLLHLNHDVTKAEVTDPNWPETLLDVSTAANRSSLLAVEKPWFDACKAAGYQAIEPDNLDSFSRAKNLFTFADSEEYLKLVIPYVHSIGLAIAQKNTSDVAPLGYGLASNGISGSNFVNTVSPAQGFDFAIAEECEQFAECGNYAAEFNPVGTAAANLSYSKVFEIEYTSDPNVTRGSVTQSAFAWACSLRKTTGSILDRDVEVLPAGTSGHVAAWCP
jgi:chitodextrinase